MTSAIDFDVDRYTATQVRERQYLDSGCVLFDTGYHYNGDTLFSQHLHKRPASISTRPNRYTGLPRDATNWFHLRGDSSIPEIGLKYHDYGPFQHDPCSSTGLPFSRLNYQDDYTSDLYNHWDVPYWPDHGDPDSQHYDLDLRESVDVGFLSAVKDDTSVSVAQNLIEYDQSVKLVTRNIERIVNTVIGFKKAFKGEWASLLKGDAKNVKWSREGKFHKPITKRPGVIRHLGAQVPEAWLEVQYGWVPGMNDVMDAMRLIDHFNQNDLYWISKEFRKSSHSDGGFFRLYGSSSTLSIPLRTRNTCLVHGDYRLSTSYMAPFSALGIATPADLVWEEIPFSFIVDWFMPIGNWLNTFDADCGKTWINGYRTQTKRITKHGIAQVEVFGPHIELAGGNADGVSYSYFTMHRELLDDFPSASPPHFKNPVSLHHLANALSLLAGAFGRGGSEVASYGRGF